MTAKLGRSSNMSALVLLNVLNELGKRDKIRGCVEQFTAFSQRV